MSKGRHSPQGSLVWLLSQDPALLAQEASTFFCLLPDLFAISFCPGTQHLMNP
jgi:hypothetical protein